MTDLRAARSRRKGPAAASQRGFALLIVLWSLVLLTLLVSQLGRVGSSETVLARNLLDAATAQAAADGAIFDAASRLVDTSQRHMSADGRTTTVTVGGSVVDVRAEDESGKIDPNVASSALLEALMRAVGSDTRTAASVSAAIVQWRFPDANSQAPAAVAADYRSAGKSYSPPFSAFQTLDEVGLVRGMTPVLLSLLAPHMTLFNEAGPDPRVADDTVLRALRQTGSNGTVSAGSRGTQGIYTIRADASAPGGSQFHRAAVIRLGAESNGAVYRVLDWR